jgi:hypothetical protein
LFLGLAAERTASKLGVLELEAPVEVVLEKFLHADPLGQRQAVELEEEVHDASGFCVGPDARPRYIDHTQHFSASALIIFYGAAAGF